MNKRMQYAYTYSMHTIYFLWYFCEYNNSKIHFAELELEPNIAYHCRRVDNEP